MSDYIKFEDVKVGDVLEKGEKHIGTCDNSPYLITALTSDEIETSNKNGVRFYFTRSMFNNADFQKINEEKPMDEYIKFEDLKVGELYDLSGGECDEYYNPYKLLAVYTAKNTKKIFLLDVEEDGEAFKETHDVKFKLHKPPLLTDESIGKEYYDDSKEENSINIVVCKYSYEGEKYFLVVADDLNTFFVDEQGVGYATKLTGRLIATGYSLTKQVENANR